MVCYVDIEKVKLFKHLLTYVEAIALYVSNLSAFIQLGALRKNQLNPKCIKSMR